MIRKEDFMVMKALYQRGVYLKDIADELGVHPRTVRRALKRNSAPERERKKTRQPIGRPQNKDRSAAQRRGLERDGHSARDPGRRLSGRDHGAAGLHPAQTGAATQPGNGAL